MNLGFTYNTMLVLAGVALLGGAAGVIGCFAVLRRRSLTGDALAHAALPGLCLSYFIVGERNLHSLLLGAFLSGIAGVGAISALRRWTRLKEDAAIAIVLSVFFGLGIVLLSVISRIPGGPRAGLESFILGKTAGMTRDDLGLITILALGTLAIVVLFYKEFKLITFDLEFAGAQGWPARSLDFLLQMLLVVAVIVGLPAVGVVLIAALLVIPGAAARFWTQRLGTLLFLSALFGVFAGVTGAWVSANLERVPTGPLVIVFASLVFLISLVFGSRRGLLGQWLQQRTYRRRFEQERLLAMLLERETGMIWINEIPRPFGWTKRRFRRTMDQGVKERLLEYRDGGVILSHEGTARAALVVAMRRSWRELLQTHPQEAPALLRLDLSSADAMDFPLP